MMQALLEDRFHLKVHRESRVVPVYALTVDKDGPRLQSTKEGSCVPVTAGDLMTPRKLEPGDSRWCGDSGVVMKGALVVYDAHGMSLDVFSKFLRLDRPVIDRTGLTGIFDIHLEWVPDPPSPPPSDGGAGIEPRPPIVDAIRKKLGLRLDPEKGPREFLVIDRVQKLSEN